MSTIHYLNVKLGDCSIIQHNSGHNTVIDVSNARTPEARTESMSSLLASLERGAAGNFQQKKYPVNPISYMLDLGIRSIFRYIQTHPDLDHMDGIEALFEQFSPLNFWDTENRKELPTSSWQGSPYREDDWQFYKQLRDSNPDSQPKRLTLLSGASGQFWNVGEDGAGGGDGLHVLAPTKQLIEAANEADEDYNRCSYVLLYRTGGSRIVFGGDSHDETWEHILNAHRNDVEGIDLLIAPHHGRKSGRSYEFLDVLRPSLTFFGNARHEDLAYEAWRRRNLPLVTNNQANCMVVDASPSPMHLYVTHENFARAVNSNTYFNSTLRAWFVGPIE